MYHLIPNKIDATLLLLARCLVSVDMFLFCLQGARTWGITSTADDDPWWSVLSSVCKKMLVSKVQFMCLGIH